MGGTMKVVRGISCGRAMILLLTVWLGFLLLAVSLLRHEPDPQVNQRISQALRDLQSLHQQRHDINKLIYEYSLGGSGMKQEERSAFLKNLRDKVREPVNSKGYDDSIDCKDGPPAEYEKVRRRLKTGIDEMWYYMNAELRKLHKEASLISPQMAGKINKIMQGGLEHKRSLIRDATMLPKVDGYSKWREKESAELSDLVQRRIAFLQTPSDCSNARKLVCNLNKGCGYGCQLHHAAYCLLVAYGTERTLVLKSKGWRYNRAGWEKVFKPVSDICPGISGAPTSSWPGSSNARVVMLGIVDSVVPRPPYLPLAVPKDLVPRISRLHGDPSVWWVGQFLKYLLRPQDDTIALLRNAASKFNFRGPVVGVHIRRTDKVGTEAAFHTVDEYMLEVEEYFKQLALTQKVEKKRIYLASDDPKVFAEVQKKYGDYEVFGDPQVAKTAAVATRYTDSSLNGIIMDIHFLSKSDFLVCTFSSQVCRVAYEIMQSLHIDAADRFRSLDDIYYYGGQGVHRKIALLAHKAEGPDQIDLEVGDTVGVAGNHWNGYSKGKNLRTNQVGLYPSFKVDEVIEAVDFPTYPEVPLSIP